MLWCCNVREAGLNLSECRAIWGRHLGPTLMLIRACLVMIWLLLTKHPFHLLVLSLLQAVCSSPLFLLHWLPWWGGRLFIGYEDTLMSFCCVYNVNWANVTYSLKQEFSEMMWSFKCLFSCLGLGVRDCLWMCLWVVSVLVWIGVTIQPPASSFMFKTIDCDYMPNSWSCVDDVPFLLLVCDLIGIDLLIKLVVHMTAV